MGAFDNKTLLPCPPEYSDYEEKTSGTFSPDTPAAISLNNLYRTDFGNGGALFSVSLVKGRKYRVAAEGLFTQASLDGAITNIFCWAPSAWEGAISDPTTEEYDGEDVLPRWCPYTSKLNYEETGMWYGGQRGEFTALETGTYVFYLWLDMVK